MSATTDSVTVDPFALQPGEAAEVGRAIARALTAARQGRTPAPPAIDVSGVWELTTRFLHGERVHRLTLRQDGAVLSGTHESPHFAGAVSGQVEADSVRFDCVARYEGNNITYRFRGTASHERMAGAVAFGTSNDHHQGEVNLAQFGEGAWEGRRIA